MELVRPFRSQQFSCRQRQGNSAAAAVAAGKPKMVALIVVARKLLTILNAILRDNRPWQTA